MMNMEKPSPEIVLRQVIGQGTTTVDLLDVAAILDLDPEELRRQIMVNRAAVGFPVCVLEIGGIIRIPRGAFLAWLTGTTQIVGETFALLAGVAPSEVREREWW